ncbi:MAG: FAD-dependent oxidoreductase, partial [Gammaproteobacteria bacterium]|nr:FAD-dependent oxidoreductase [Gammaproteobacteria bacterium]
MGITPERYDVIIVGGGIVGLTVALLLSNSDQRIALLDKKAYVASFKAEQYDMRVSAITPASIKLFEQLAVWPEMVSLRVSPFTHMEVW